MSDEYTSTTEEVPNSDEHYEVFVQSGSAEKKFREFCEALGTDIEISWKGTVDF